MANVVTGSMLPLPSLVRAAAHDTAAKCARAAGRSAWSRADYNAACRHLNNTINVCFGKGPKGRIKFAIAEQLQAAGVLTIGMKPKDFFAAIEAAYRA